MSNNRQEVIIAYCGLACSNCGMYIRKKCLDCHSNKPMNQNCKIKKCAISKKFTTCAECKDFQDLRDCKKLYNFVSRFFGFIFHTNCIGNLNRIREIGLNKFKEEKRVDAKP